MAAVSLPSRLLCRKFGAAFFVKNVLLGILGGAIAPSAPPWLRLWQASVNKDLEAYMKSV